MYHIICAILSIFICYTFGDWRNWKIYYPTILFFILSGVVCILLTFNHPLWLYECNFLHNTFSDLLISITAYPSTVMVFIPYFPKGIKRIIPYISFYVAIYTIAELVGVKLGYFTYHNGWNVMYTIIFNYIMFSILMLHYKKPLYAWIIALISPHILFFIMNIPYNSIR